MLTACTAGAAGLHLDVLRTDLDLAVVVQLRHDLQRSEAGLASGVGIEGRNTHQTVNTVLTLQIAVGILPLDEDGGGLDARLIAGLVVHELIGVAVALSPAGIHPVEHLRPVLGLGAACSGVEGEDGVVGVVLAGQQRCQTERSQFQNRDNAMKMLRAKLAELKLQQHAEKISDLKGVQMKIEWGSQIRSYVFMPYTLAKDTRTGYEMGNIQAVMDGDIDGFINAYLTAAANGEIKK